MKIAVTVDVENDLGFLDSRLGIDEGLPVILQLLKKHGIRGTFFVSGVAQAHLRRSGLLGEIDGGGHEIASHGYRHADYRSWSYADICAEVEKSKRSLEDMVQKEVAGYRAPQFLVNAPYVRALDRCGFLYDSSLPDPRGISAARLLRKVRVDHELREAVARSNVREFIISSVPYLNVPHGLLWVNLMTLPLYRRLFRPRSDELSIFYLHPFDVVRNKQRVSLDFKRKLFYLKNNNDIALLLEELLLLWKARSVEFVRLGDQLRNQTFKDSL